MTGVAVKVTDVPAFTGLADAVIVTLAATGVLILIVTLFEVTTF